METSGRRRLYKLRKPASSMQIELLRDPQVERGHEWLEGVVTLDAVEDGCPHSGLGAAACLARGNERRAGVGVLERQELQQLCFPYIGLSSRWSQENGNENPLLWSLVSRAGAQDQLTVVRLIGQFYRSVAACKRAQACLWVLAVRFGSFRHIWLACFALELQVPLPPCLVFASLNQFMIAHH